MKKTILGIIILIVLLFSFAVAESNRSITFENATYAVYLGKPQKIVATVEKLSDDAPKNTTLVWKSSDETIAKVSNNGTVTGVSAGTVQITAVAKDDESIQASVAVEIRIPVKTVKIDPPAVTLTVGGAESLSKAELKYTIAPEDAFDQTVIWSSSNEKVATVDQNGVVTALSKGNAVITATSTDSTGNKKATCKVTVGQAVTGVEFDQAEYTVLAPKTVQIKATISPKDATNKKLIWTSSNEEVAKVSDRGVVQGISEGEATITAVPADGNDIAITCKVKVIVPVKKITIYDSKQLTMPVESTIQLTASIEPENATIKDIIWSSTNEKVVTVNESGLVTAVGNGSAKIKASSTDGSKVVCSLNVKIDKFDIIFTKPIPVEKWLYTTTYGGEKIKIKTKNNTVNITCTGISSMFTATGPSYGTQFTITPVKAGSDEITFTFYNSKVKYMVYISPETFENQQSMSDSEGNEAGTAAESEKENVTEASSSEGKDQEENETSKEPVRPTELHPVNSESKIKIQDIPWGISYREFVDGEYVNLDHRSPTGGWSSGGDGENSLYTVKMSYEEVAGWLAEPYFNFTLKCDEQGEWISGLENSMFYKAGYHFLYVSYSDSEKTYGDLYKKLIKLYGSPKELGGSWAEWHDNGVTLRLENEYGVNISYTWDEGETMREKYLKLAEKRREKEKKKELEDKADDMTGL